MTSRRLAELRCAALGAAGGLWLFGCVSASIDGGSVTAPGSIPTGTVVGRWQTDDCRDARGVPARELAATVTLFRPPTGGQVLTEAREGFDTLLVTNRFSSDNGDVFQVALKSGSSAPLLHEYRLPPEGSGFGRLILVRGVRAWNRGDEGGFAATHDGAVLRCTLTPEPLQGRRTPSSTPRAKRAREGGGGSGRGASRGGQGPPRNQVSRRTH